MGKIFKKQTKLHIELTMNIDITGASEHIIKFIKPDNSEGEFAATIKEAENGILQYDVNPDGTDIDQAGKWIFWAYVVLSDGRSIPGEAVSQMIYKEGAI